MHAYAGEDPLFLAMNRRMQRETKGALGSLCVQCHAPVAVQMGKTVDGLNLASLPPEMRGVTCFFCHSADSLKNGPLNNNPIVLATDGVMRAQISDPVKNEAHAAIDSPFLDQTVENSTFLCGSCHDIAVPAGAHIERTFKEWQDSRFGNGDRQKQNCGSCHMKGHDGLAANAPGVFNRTVHDHSMAAVDIALTPFAEQDAQLMAVQGNLDTAIQAKLCVSAAGTGAQIDVTLVNEAVGHNWPSGSTQDRRAWVEVDAELAGSVVFQSGAVPADQAVATFMDPNLFLLRDRMFDAAQKETKMFWEAATFQSAQLPAAVTSDALDPRFNHSVTKSYAIPTAVPDHVKMHLHLRAVDVDLIDDLIQSGDLDPMYRAKLSTFTLASAELEWKGANGFGCVP